eukprot:5094272-Amphidinium_carterae.1
MKAFLAAENPQIKARYNSCGFIKHQLRVCCNNTFDPSAEDKSEGGQGFITYKSSLRLVEVAFPPGISVTEVKAMMKRATWVVFGERVYVRIAGIGEKPVPVYAYLAGCRDLLKDTCKARFAAYKEDREWERDLVGEAWSRDF